MFQSVNSLWAEWALEGILSFVCPDVLLHVVPLDKGPASYLNKCLWKGII